MEATAAVPLSAVLEQHFASLHSLIGGTPAFLLDCRLDGLESRVLAKFEVANFTGSIKDRMALHVLEDAHRRGMIEPGAEIAEATSGNTGIALAAIGRALGHPVRIAMPDGVSRERSLVLRALGATVMSVSPEEGGFAGCVERVEEYAREHPGVFLPRQFDNPVDVEAHERTTGPELLAQARSAGVPLDAFVAGVGTGGTVMGVGRHLRAELGERVRVHPLEPAESPTLRAGRKVGSHRIQGLSDAFVPPIVDLSELDAVVDVHDGDAILMAQRMAGELGIGLGISSGANLLGALLVALELGPGAVVGTVFADSNKKYLSTDLCGEEPVRADYLTPRVELLGCRVVPGMRL